MSNVGLFGQDSVVENTTKFNQILLMFWKGISSWENSLQTGHCLLESGWGKYIWMRATSMHTTTGWMTPSGTLMMIRTSSCGKINTKGGDIAFFVPYKAQILLPQMILFLQARQDWYQDQFLHFVPTIQRITKFSMGIISWLGGVSSFSKPTRTKHHHIW